MQALESKTSSFWGLPSSEMMEDDVYTICYYYWAFKNPFLWERLDFSSCSRKNSQNSQMWWKLLLPRPSPHWVGLYTHYPPLLGIVLLYSHKYKTQFCCCDPGCIICSRVANQKWLKLYPKANLSNNLLTENQPWRKHESLDPLYC